MADFIGPFIRALIWEYRKQKRQQRAVKARRGKTQNLSGTQNRWSVFFRELRLAPDSGDRSRVVGLGLPPGPLRKVPAQEQSPGGISDRCGGEHMAYQIPGTTERERAEETLQIINGLLPSKGTITPPTGKSDQVRYTLTHDALVPKMREMRKQKPRVAATFRAEPKSQLRAKRSFQGNPVERRDVTVLVPLLGKDIDLSENHRGEPCTYVTSVPEARALARKICSVWP